LAPGADVADPAPPEGLPESPGDGEAGTGAASPEGLVAVGVGAAPVPPPPGVAVAQSAASRRAATFSAAFSLLSTTRPARTESR
jgi:hypothetical protein